MFFPWFYRFTIFVPISALRTRSQTRKEKPDKSTDFCELAGSQLHAFLKCYRGGE
jgi:hypothetical protein